MFLTAVDILHIPPQILGADWGSETGMIINAHWQLYQSRQHDISVNDAIMFRTFVANVRIESWWSQLSKGQTYKWQVRIIFPY